MTDGSLRKLSREAATPQERLELARGLERSGRRDALESLPPARADAE